MMSILPPLSTSSSPPFKMLLFALLLLTTGVQAQPRETTVVIGEVAQRDTNRPIYDIKFPQLDEFLAAGAAEAETAPGVTTMRMVTARGQAMRCLIPSPAPLSTPNPVAEEHRFDDIDHLLSEYKNKCFVRKEGWWTYEFCYGKHVIQKHIIPKDRDPLDGEVEDTFTLGLFDHQLDLERRKNVSQVSTKDAIFTQMFVNGSICDMTNKSRRVLVKYLCRDEALQLRDASKKNAKADMNFLKQIREVESCVYEVEFMNGAICKHPVYIENLVRAARPIHCSMEENEGPFEGLLSKTYKKASLNL